jgi:DNA-binding response OmpR family regulator
MVFNSVEVRFMKGLKVLALGDKQFTRQISQSLSSEEKLDLVCESDMVEAIIRLKRERFALALVDSRIPELEVTCYRINTLNQTPLALITRDSLVENEDTDLLDVDACIPWESNRYELLRNCEEIYLKGIFQPHKVRSQVKIMAMVNDLVLRDEIKCAFRFYWPDAEVFFAFNDKEACELIENKTLDIILWNLKSNRSPDFKTIKKVRNYSQIPVILLTPAGLQDSVSRNWKSCADGYLAGPFRGIQLITRVRNIIRKTDAGLKTEMGGFGVN